MLSKIISKYASMVVCFAVIAAMGLGVDASFYGCGHAEIDVFDCDYNNHQARAFSAAVPCGNVEEFSVEVVSDAPEAAEALDVSESAKEMVCAIMDVNVRTGPGADCERIATLKCGECIVRTGIVDNGWSCVDYNGQIAYVHSDYLCSFFIEDADVIVYATTDVNVRTGPGADCERIATLKRGECVVRTGIVGNGWSRVNYNSQVAYVHSDYLYDFRSCETFYASAKIDVRSGPGVDYLKIGTLNSGDAVSVIVKLDNGWSKILYNDGAEAYVLSGYLASSKLDHDEEGAGKRCLGRLTIPSVGVDVALFACSMRSKYLSVQQEIIDADDSAAYLNSDAINGNIIVDHASQDFYKMKASVPYETYAYIDFGSHVQKYICVGIGIGQNFCSDLVDWNGKSLLRGDITGGLAMFTCNDETGLSVTISYWEPV